MRDHTLFGSSAGVLMLLLACLLVTADTPKESAKEQEQAIAEIKKLGGKVIRDEKSPGKPVVEVDLNQTQATDAALARLKSLTKLQRLLLGSTKVTDAGLVHLKSLTDLQILSLTGTQVTDMGVDDLHRALPKVKIARSIDPFSK